MRLTDYARHPGLALRKARWRLLHAMPRRDVTVDTYNGRLTFDSRDRLIGKYLYVQRAYERRYIESAMTVLERDGWLARGGLLLDVGANIGMIAIALLRQGWFDRAVAFEPAPGNLRLLAHNITQNGLSDRIRIVPAALSDAPGEMDLELSDYNSGDNRLRSAPAPGAWHEDRRAAVRVRITTLDAALDDAGIDPRDVRLAWVDIQGHEGRFFAGATRTLGSGVPVVSEFWPYGILRSGVTRNEYVRRAATLFTHVYELGGGGPRLHPVAALDAMFDRYAAPKQMAEVIFVTRSAP